MNKQLLFLTILSLLNIKYLRGQDLLNKLNDLPTTSEVRAPEFNTVKKYFFKIDSTKNNLVIQDIRKSKDDRVHFYQFMYEIPLNQLNSKSFQITRNDDNQISINIYSTAKDVSIMFYMFDETKVSSLKNVNSVHLFGWPYSKELYEKINEAVDLFSESFPNNDSPLNMTKTQTGSFKYIAKNVTAINAKMDEDLRIFNDYYFKQFISDNGSNLYPKMVKEIKKALKSQDINDKNPVPVMIYTDKNGVIESIFIVNQPTNKYCEIDLKNLKPIRDNNRNNHPTKYVFLLK